MRKLLTEICNPKQWKTISTSNLLSEGYTVYGANGIIGHYNEYTHEKPTLMITCRGATSGNLNISEPFSYINGNAMALDDLNNDIDLRYLYYYLRNRGLKDTISGSAQPQITRAGLSKVEVEYPDINFQKKIVNLLDRSQELINKRKEQIEALDELVKSKFNEMFAEKDRYNYIKIEELVSNKSDIVDGPFGSNLKTVDYVDDGVRVIQINNIGESSFRDKNKRYITEEKYNSLLKHSVIPGDLVVAKMGEPIGRTCIVPNYISKAVIVADCMKIRPNLEVINRKYLEFLLNTDEVKEQFRKYSQGSTRVRLNLTMLRQVEVLYPPMELQNEFADFVKQVDKLKFKLENSLKELEDNFYSLMQRAFKGELF